MCDLMRSALTNVPWFADLVVAHDATGMRFRSRLGGFSVELLVTV